MSAADLQGLLTLPAPMLAEAMRSEHIPDTGSKAQNAKELAMRGLTADKVRAICSGGSAASAGLDQIRSRVDGVLTQFNVDLSLIRGQLDGLSAGSLKQFSDHEQALSDVDQAVKAAGAVAARAEALALKQSRTPLDQAAISQAVRDAVRAAVLPIEDALKSAPDAVKSEVLTVCAGPVRTAPCVDVFGVNLTDRKGNPVMVELWDHPDAPAVDPCYIWTASTLSHLLLSQATGENLWLGGPKGTGKSEAAKQFAARTGRPFTRVNFTKHSAPEDFLGAVGLVNGATEYVEGDLLMAYQTPGTVLLLDEISNADPGNLAVLNALLEPNARVNIGGKIRTKSTGVLVLGADNTLGNGDDSGRYSGTRLMNSSLLDRFARVLPFKYLPEDVETDAVVKHTGCTDKLARHIVQAINAARAKVDTGDIVDAPSIRQIVAFVRALALLSVDDAWETTISSKQPAESALALTAIKAACLNNTLIEGEL